ncbi:MAG: hypothetical protein HZA25_03060 [Candidatus Niyogibacteria bacterium]|nr:hypothetical protein [Candidatus Niyogibacteria bacterium]
MKNINYNLLKLLHTKLDTIWRLEKHYLADAETAQCHSAACLATILEEDKKHAAALREEIKMRMDAGIFD